MPDNDLPPPSKGTEDASQDGFLDASLKGLSGEELSLTVYHISQEWADFAIQIISPSIESYSQPIIHVPEDIGRGEKEFVYNISDWGNMLSTSKGVVAGFVAGGSMCRLNYTIEKMIFLLVERLKSGGIDAPTEVEVSIRGHLLAKRYAFASIINLEENVYVANFDPEDWGEKYIANLSYLSSKGYGIPSKSPRDIYRISRSPKTKKKNPKG